MPSACAATRPSSNAPTGAPPFRRSSRSNRPRSARFRPNGCRCGESSRRRRRSLFPWRRLRQRVTADIPANRLASCPRHGSPGPRCLVPEGARSSLSCLGRRRRSGVSLVARPGTGTRPDRRRGRLGGRQHRAGRHAPASARRLAASGSAGPLLAVDRPRMRGGELPAQCVSRRDVPGRRHARVRRVPGARDRPRDPEISPVHADFARLPRC